MKANILVAAVLMTGCAGQVTSDPGPTREGQGVLMLGPVQSKRVEGAQVSYPADCHFRPAYDATECGPNYSFDGGPPHMVMCSPAVNSWEGTWVAPAPGCAVAGFSNDPDNNYAPAKFWCCP